MEFEVEHRFDRPVETVLRMFTDRSYFERKAPSTGSLDLRVLREERDDQRFEIEMSFRSSADVQVPDFARKFMPGQHVRVVEVDSWHIGHRLGRIRIDLGGLPVKVGAEMKLEPTAAGAVNRLKWTVAVSVPLIGGKLERVIAEDLRGKMERDLQASRALLNEY